MQRRRLVISGLLVGSGVAAAQAPLPAPSDNLATTDNPPRFNVPLNRLQSEVAQRFPLRYPVAGLLNLDLNAPRLSLLPDQNRLRAVMPMSTSGAALPLFQQGSCTVDFALRYEHSDRSLRAHQLKVYRFRFSDLSPEALDMLNTYAPPLAEQALREVVLYQLQPKETAMAALLGLRPGRITVTEQGLSVELVTQPL